MNYVKRTFCYTFLFAVGLTAWLSFLLSTAAEDRGHAKIYCAWIECPKGHEFTTDECQYFEWVFTFNEVTKKGFTLPVNEGKEVWHGRCTEGEMPNLRL